MKRFHRWMAGLAAFVMLMCGVWAAGRAEADVALFAVNVGKGDALLVKAGDWVGLIDAGKARAMGRVAGTLRTLGIEHLDGVFLTHTDGDHAEGLDWLAKSDIRVDHWYASAMYTGVKEKKHPAVKAAALRETEVEWLRRGDALDLGGGASLKVLAPASLFQDKDDNNSLVMMLQSDRGRILLTGDMELPQEAELLSLGDDLACDVLKAPNHGDDDTLSDAFARAASARVALISTDSVEKPGTPDPGVVARLQAAGSRVVVTQDAGLGQWITLTGDGVEVRPVDIDAPEISGLALRLVDPGDDLVAVGNDGAAAVDLTGCYLVSDKGDELFAFPEGTAIAPGQTLTIGTNTTEGGFDLLWDDKKVVSKKKRDVITLYDAWGRALDSRDNGLAE